MDPRSCALSSVVILVALLAAPAVDAQSLGACGDCNGDMSTTILDALLAAQFGVGLVPLVSPNYEQCNVRGTPGGPATPGAAVDVLDALAIAQSAAGIPVVLNCAAQPTCALNMPSGGTVTGDVSWSFDLADIDGDASSLTFQWSSDAGVTFVSATPAAGSPLGNPAPGVLPAPGLGFIWDSVADLPGLAQPVTLRISANDARTPAATCITTTTVDNTNAPPACVINSPIAGVQMGDVSFNFDALDADLDPLAITFEFNAGAGFVPASVAAASPITMNPAAGVAPAAGLIFIWDSIADIARLSVGVVFRITVNDGVGVPSTCSATFDVNNNDAPGCSINSPAGGTQVGNVTVDFDATDPEGDLLTVTFQYNAGAGFLNATVAAGSPIPTNPAVGVTPGAGLLFRWNSAADIPRLAAGVTFRITVDDGVAAPTTCSQTFDVNNNDAPSCTINSPVGGVHSANVTINFDAVDPEADPLTITFQYNAGAGFLNATAAGTSPLANPASMVAPGAGLTFVWNSAADLTGLQPGVVFRITVDDGLAAAAACTATFDVDNNQPPSCMITSPVAGTDSGDVTIVFNASDPELDPLTISFQFNAGAGFMNATRAGTSPLMNPAVGVAPAIGLTYIWNSFADIPGTAPLVTFRVTVSDGVAPAATCTSTFAIDNGLSCGLTAPAAGALVSGSADFTFTLTTLAAATATFQYSTNAGVSFTNCTTDGASLLANPAAGLMSGSLTYRWDTHADVPGSEAVTFRISLSDGSRMSSCSRNFTADNRATCTINAPVGGTLGGDITVDFDLGDPNGDLVNLNFFYSIDSGVTWTRATAAGASPRPNPSIGEATPQTGAIFLWDSAADIPAVASNVTFSVAAWDGVLTSTCRSPAFMVLNQSMPSCAFTAPGVGAPLAGDATIIFDALDPDPGTLAVTVQYSTDGGATWGLATPAGSSPAPMSVNPAAGVTPAAGIVFIWNSAADVPASSAVRLRLLVSDSFTTPAICTRDFTVDNRPACLITAPVAGPLSGNVTMTFNATDGNGDPLTLTFQYSTNAGATWNNMTVAAGSPISPNPAMGITPGTGLMFSWNTLIDVPPIVSPKSTLLRVRADDATSVSTCQVGPITVDNPRRNLLTLRPVDALAAVGVPSAGAPSAGNPKGNYANLNRGLFNNTVMLGTGGNPVILYQVGDSFQMVLEGNFSQAPAQTNVAPAANPDGSTFWSSNNGNVSVSVDGLLVGVGANSCSTISATFTPNGSTSFGPPLGATFQACVDLGGVDRATRTALRQDLSGPNLAVGDIDLDLPGLPSGPVPPGVGALFQTLATMNSGASSAAAYGIRLNWDLSILGLNTAVGTQGVSDSSLAAWGAPLGVNPTVPGQLRWNDVISVGGATGVNDIGNLNFRVVGGGTTLVDPTVETFVDSAATPMTIGAATPRAGIAGRGNVTFAGGAGRRALSLRPVSALAATGTPIQGVPSAGNPNGNWAGLRAGEFNTTISLFAGGNPVLLYNVGDTFQIVLEASFDMPTAMTNVAAASSPDGSTLYSVSGSAVSVGANGLITALVGNDCSRVTATYIPGGAAFGAPLVTEFMACVDLGGVDRATRIAVNQAGTAPNLRLGDVDADLPGMPSAMPPVGVGTSFGVHIFTNTSDSVAGTVRDLGSYQLDVGFDTTILDIDQSVGTTGVSASTRPEFGAPAAVNPMELMGLLRWNDMQVMAGVTGANDIGTVNFVPVLAGTTLLTQQVTTLRDLATITIGAATPRFSIAGRGNMTFAGVGQIDLRPRNVTGPVTISQGTSAMVNRVIDNLGTLPALNFDEKIYLSTDAVITAADIELATFNNPFLAGSSSDMSARMVSVSTGVAPGLYFYGVRVDTPNVITESNEANNSSASAGMVTIVRDIDLTVNSVVPSPTSTQAGAGINVSRNVQNLGPTPSPGFVEAYYLSTDMVVGPGDVALGSFMHPAMTGFQTTSLSRGLVVPGGTAVGSYFILARVDDTSLITETSEANNVGVSSPQLSVTSIDLVVHSITVTGPVVVNPMGTTMFSRTVENLGTVASGAFTERVMLSTDATITGGDIFVADFAHASMPGGAVDAGSRMITIPGATAPGVYFVGVIVDPTGVILEINESNNAAASANTVTVNGTMDLQAVSVTGRAYATMGLPRRFDRTLRNNAGSPSPAFREGWYLSTDATITVGDIFIGSFMHAGLAAGATESISRDLNIPTGFAAGNYFVGVIADDTMVVGETDETNNAIASGAVVPIIVEVLNLGTIAIPVSTTRPAAPGQAVGEIAGVTSFAIVGLGRYQSSGNFCNTVLHTSLVDPVATVLLDGTNCDPAFKNTTQSLQSGSVFQDPNGDTSEHRECGSGPAANPSNPTRVGNYLSRWFNINSGPAPGAIDLTMFNIRKFDPVPGAGTLYINVVVVGDFLVGDVRNGGDPASGPMTAASGAPYTGAGANELFNIIERLQAFYAVIGVTVVADIHFLGGAFGNALEVVDSSADANGNGVADTQEALCMATPLSTYEPGNVGMNVFLIRSITSPSGSVAGIASGIPGVPVLQGNPHSGVISSQFGTRFSMTSASGRQVQAEILAHEAGHQLGMFHTTEFSGNPNHDPVPDTIRCLAGSVTPANCAGQGDQYVMFPQASTDPAVFFTTQQGFIINRNPAVR